MKAHEFCYWLQGYFEIMGIEAAPLDSDQVRCIEKHLALVFKHEIDPKYGDEEHQEELNTLHSHGPIRPPRPNPPYRPSSGGTTFKC